MIKTNLENFVIPLKIRVLENSINLNMQNVDFGLVSDNYVTLIIKGLPLC